MSETVPARGQALNSPLKVWHVVGPMNHGGAEVMVMELLRHKAATTQVDFLVHMPRDRTLGNASFDKEIEQRGGRLLPIMTPTQSGLRAYFRTFRAHIAEAGQPDVIHIHLNARSGLVALAAWRAGIKRIIVHSHAALTFRGSLAYRVFANAELCLSKIIFAALATDFWGCSKDAVDSLFSRVLSRRQPRVVINNAIDIGQYTTVTAPETAALRQIFAPGDGLLIGTVGRVVRHKNALFLVDILGVLRRRGEAATVVIVGREADFAYCDEIRARAAELGLSDAVRFVDARDDIPQVMAALDVFVSPALREGFGLVGLEAQAAGTPCVLSTGFPAAIDMNLGLVTVPEGFDPEIWADAILSASDKPCPEKETITKVITARGYSSAANTNKIERAWREPNYLPGDIV